MDQYRSWGMGATQSDSWRPELRGGQASLYRQLVEALARDVASGELPAGERLPPQRVLADRLGLSVGTVTKAYVEAERQGLVAGHVGRGTYVAEPRQAAAETVRDRSIDLAFNILPPGAPAARFPEALNALRRRSDLLELLNYAPPAGHDAHRQAASRFLAQLCGYRAPWERLVLTTGAQQAMALAFSAICAPGDVILCEEPTFSGMKSIAAACGYRLVGVAMDGEGIQPQALARAIRATGARALYLMPTVQNPTGRTMGRVRREEIAALVRKHELWLVEDDNYALFAPEPERRAPRLADLAPARTFYVSGLSKCLAPGLRVGFLVCPDLGLVDRVIRAVRAQLYAPSAFGPVVFAHWVEEGSALAMAEAQRQEIVERYGLAQAILGGRMEALAAPAPHVWIACGELEAERAAGLALRRGVAITPPDAPFPPGTPITGLRICIGAPPTRAELEKGLGLFAAALGGGGGAADLAVV
jgi:DNA-binding transcriptional MocR family regulator